MRRSCEDCGKVYDDLYRLTICPHERFDMNTVVANGDGVVGVATSIEELDRMMGTKKEEKMDMGDKVEVAKVDDGRRVQPMHGFTVTVHADPPMSVAAVRALLNSGLRVEGTPLRIVTAVDSE